MISKVIFTKNLSGTIKYIMNPAKDATIVLHKGIYCTNIDQIIKDFEIQAQLKPLEVKGIHIPLSFHYNDKHAVDKYSKEIVQDWLDDLERHGYTYSQYICVRHYDQDHKNPHLHILLNIVNTDGRRVKVANIGLACKKASQSTTERWNLTPANHLKSQISYNSGNFNFTSSYNRGWNQEKFENIEHIANMVSTTNLLDLLLPIPPMVNACSGVSTPKRRKDDDKRKKKYKKYK